MSLDINKPQFGEVVIYKPEKTHPAFDKALGVVTKVEEETVVIHSHYKSEELPHSAIIDIVGKNKEFAEYLLDSSRRLEESILTTEGAYTKDESHGKLTELISIKKYFEEFKENRSSRPFEALIGLTLELKRKTIGLKGKSRFVAINHKIYEDQVKELERLLDGVTMENICHDDVKVLHKLLQYLRTFVSG